MYRYRRLLTRGPIIAAVHPPASMFFGLFDSLRFAACLRCSSAAEVSIDPLGKIWVVSRGSGVLHLLTAVRGGGRGYCFIPYLEAFIWSGY